MSTSMTIHGCVAQRMTSKANPRSERISRWLTMEMNVAGRRNLPIHIDTDIEDDDDPFEPQPKQFLLTDGRKEIIKEELYDRQKVYTIRKYRRGEQEKRKRIVEERRALRKSKRSLARLPTELILEVIRHTHLDDLQSFMRSGKTVNNVFRDNEATVPSGIEAAQFSELKWLFGSGRRRSDEQKQALKDYIGTHLFLSYPQTIPETFDKIDKGEFADWSAIRWLRRVKDGLTNVVGYHSSMGSNILRRSALCLEMFSNFRITVERECSDRSLGKDNQPDKAKGTIMVNTVPMEERIRLFERQPVAIQESIRVVLGKTMIDIIGYLDQWPLEPGESGDYPLMGPETRDWIVRYYGPDKVDGKMEQEHMGRWISRLAAGYILEVLFLALPWTGPNWEDIAGQIRERNGFFKDALGEELRKVGVRTSCGRRAGILQTVSD